MQLDMVAFVVALSQQPERRKTVYWPLNSLKFAKISTN